MSSEEIIKSYIDLNSQLLEIAKCHKAGINNKLLENNLNTIKKIDKAISNSQSMVNAEVLGVAESFQKALKEVDAMVNPSVVDMITR